jgi:FolB domain-containing protein
MDYIHIDKLVVRGRHGVMDRERKVEQEFEITLRLGVGDTTVAARSEKLDDAVDYAPIKDKIVSIIEGRSFYLIEKLADTIATEVMKDTRIQTLELTIRKPEVWGSGVPGLTIVRAR